MNIAAMIILLIHGIAHLPGFAVYLKLTKMDELPYKTTIFGNAIYVGDGGIKIVGILWLLTAIGFFISGIAVLLKTPWWSDAALGITIFSLLLCLSGLPEAKIGVIVNIALLIYLIWKPFSIT